MVNGTPRPDADFSADWRVRAITATRGNQTLMGTALIAILGREPANPPRFLAPAVVGEAGEVRATFQRKDGQVMLGAVVSPSVQEFVGGWRRLADLLKLNDADRLAMFAEVRKWIEKDMRPEATRGDLFK